MNCTLLRSFICCIRIKVTCQFLPHLFFLHWNFTSKSFSGSINHSYYLKDKIIRRDPSWRRLGRVFSLSYNFFKNYFLIKCYINNNFYLFQQLLKILLLGLILILFFLNERREITIANLLAIRTNSMNISQQKWPFLRQHLGKMWHLSLKFEFQYKRTRL